MLVALMKKNPLQGLSFHTGPVDTDFQFPFFPVFYLSLFISCEFFFPVFQPLYSTSISHCLLWVISISMPYFHILYRCREGVSILVLEWTIYYGGMGKNEKTSPDNQFTSKLCPASQFVSIVDFVFYLQIRSSGECPCLYRSMLHIPSLSSCYSPLIQV